MAVFQMFKGSVIPIPLDQSNQYYFDTLEEQNTFFNGKTKLEYTDFNFARVHEAVIAPITYQAFREGGYRYCRYQLDGGTKWYYAFIVDAAWNNDKSTIFYLVEDVFQTTLFNAVLEYSYVAQNHYAAHAFYASAQDYSVNRYMTKYTFDMIGTSMMFNNGVPWFIISSSCDFLTSGGTESNPVIKTPIPSFVGGCPNQTALYCFPLTTQTVGSTTYAGLDEFFNQMRDLPWVAQCINSITFIPYQIIASYSGKGIFDIGNGHSGMRLINGTLTETSFSIPSPYTALNDKYPFNIAHNTSYQMYASPYTKILLCSIDGNRVELDLGKYSYAVTPKANIEFVAKYEVSANPKILIVPKSYAGQDLNYDYSLIYTNFPKFEVVYDSGKLYLAQTTHQIAQQRINAANAAGLANQSGALASAAISNAQAQYNMNQKFAVAGNIAGAVGSLFSLNLGGVLSNALGAAQTAANTQYGNQSYAIQQAQNRAQTAMATNNIYASLKMAEAARMDGQLVAPGVTGMSEGNAIVLSGEKNMPLIWIEYQSAVNYEFEQIAESFFRTGFRIDNFMLPNRTSHNGQSSIYNFVYLKCHQANISGDVTESELETLKQLYENGVTLWQGGVMYNI